jgi:hypothetical protein
MMRRHDHARDHDHGRLPCLGELSHHGRERQRDAALPSDRRPDLHRQRERSNQWCDPRRLRQRGTDWKRYPDRQRRDWELIRCPWTDLSVRSERRSTSRDASSVDSLLRLRMQALPNSSLQSLLPTRGKGMQSVACVIHTSPKCQRVWDRLFAEDGGAYGRRLEAIKLGASRKRTLIRSYPAPERGAIAGTRRPVAHRNLEAGATHSRAHRRRQSSMSSLLYFGMATIGAWPGATRIS